MNTTRVAPPVPAPMGRNAAMAPSLDSSAWAGLVSEAGRFGVAIDAKAAARFDRYRDLLVEWNGLMNLTAVRDPAEIERRLFLDALAMVPVLDLMIAASGIDATPALIDVGAGAGFPGLALKIARPELRVTLVDATAKKVEFLTAVISDLALEGIAAVHGRAEELGKDVSYRERFQIATARAVASLPVLLEYVVPFLRVGGTALLPKGQHIEDELGAGQRVARLLGAEIVSAEPLAVPATRLVLARKIGATPKQYPRRTGLPSREPLARQG